MLDDVPKRKRGMVSLTPLIDVVFLLLIFFMLTTSFMTTQSLSVVTPAPSADELPQDARVVEIWLMGDGTLRGTGDPVEADLPAGAGKSVSGGRGGMAVSSVAEQGSPTQALVGAVEAARISGANGVGTARVEKIKP